MFQEFVEALGTAAIRPRSTSRLADEREIPAFKSRPDDKITVARLFEKIDTVLTDKTAIVSDIEMPGMSGFDLAEVLRANPLYADVPIIALSSHSTPAVIERGRRAGFHNFVAKFDRQGLLAALKHVPQEIRGEISKAAA